MAKRIKVCLVAAGVALLTYVAHAAGVAGAAIALYHDMNLPPR